MPRRTRSVATEADKAFAARALRGFGLEAGGIARLLHIGQGPTRRYIAECKPGKAGFAAAWNLFVDLERRQASLSVAEDILRIALGRYVRIADLVRIAQQIFLAVAELIDLPVPAHEVGFGDLLKDVFGRGVLLGTEVDRRRQAIQDLLESAPMNPDSAEAVLVSYRQAIVSRYRMKVFPDWSAETVPAIRGILEMLGNRECEVLTRRYGLAGESAQTLSRVAVDLGISYERVRQIEAAALDRLRHPDRASLLRPFYRRLGEYCRIVARETPPMSMPYARGAHDRVQA